MTLWQGTKAVTRKEYTVLFIHPHKLAICSDNTRARSPEEAIDKVLEERGVMREETGDVVVLEGKHFPVA